MTHLHEIQLHADGKILAVGSTYDGSQSKLALVRYTSSGMLDTSFDGDGKVVTDLIGTYAQDGKSLVVRSDGKIVVGGYTIISNLDANAFTGEARCAAWSPKMSCSASLDAYQCRGKQPAVYLAAYYSSMMVRDDGLYAQMSWLSSATSRVTGQDALRHAVRAIKRLQFDTKRHGRDRATGLCAVGRNG